MEGFYFLYRSYILHTFPSYFFTNYKVFDEGEGYLKGEDDLGGGLVDCVLLMTLPSLESSGVLGGGGWKSSQNFVKIRLDTGTYPVQV